MASLSEEVNQIKFYLDAIQSAIYGKEKDRLTKEMFVSLSKTNHILEHESFRQVVKEKIAEARKNPSLHESIMQLCAKLQTYEPGVEIPECAPIYRVLGSGEYGIVFDPALPNNEVGENNVTKVFYNEEDYERLVDRLGTIRNVMGENAGFPYKRTYTAKNLRAKAPDVYQKLKAKRPYYNNDATLDLLRMPKLGVDADHVKDAREELLKLPIPVLLKQIQRLLHQTNSMAERRYIHGDIRTPNLMIHPSTGKLTIVDYDWFLPFNTFLYRYGFGFYSNPPEWLMPEAHYANNYNSNNNGNNTKRDSRLNDYIFYNLKKFPHAFKGVTKDDLKTMIHEANKDNETYIDTVETRDYFQSPDVLLTFDNYGLALTLLNVLYELYPSVEDGALQKTIDLLKRMRSMRIAERPTPNQAAVEMDAIVAEMDVHGADTRRERKRARKTRRRTRARN